MLESLNYSFRNPKNTIWVIYRIKQLRNYKKTMGSSEDPSLVNNFDELGVVYTLKILTLSFPTFFPRRDPQNSCSYRELKQAQCSQHNRKYERTKTKQKDSLYRTDIMLKYCQSPDRNSRDILRGTSIWSSRGIS